MYYDVYKKRFIKSKSWKQVELYFCLLELQLEKLDIFAELINEQNRNVFSAINKFRSETIK